MFIIILQCIAAKSAFVLEVEAWIKFEDVKSPLSTTILQLAKSSFQADLTNQDVNLFFKRYKFVI